MVKEEAEKAILDLKNRITQLEKARGNAGATVGVWEWVKEHLQDCLVQ